MREEEWKRLHKLAGEWRESDVSPFCLLTFTLHVCEVMVHRRRANRSVSTVMSSQSSLSLPADGLLEAVAIETG